MSLYDLCFIIYATIGSQDVYTKIFKSVISGLLDYCPAFAAFMYTNLIQLYRMLQNVTTDQTQTLLAIGTSYVQGEDVAAKGRIILVSVGQDPQEPSSWVCTASIQLLMSCRRIFCL